MHIRKTGMGCVLAGMLASAGFGGAVVSDDGATLVLSADADETLTYSDALAGTVTKILKIGKGRYVFAPTTHTFGGSVEIQEGVLSGNRSHFGKPSAWKILPEGSVTEHSASTAGATLLFDVRPDDYGHGEWYKPTGSLEIGGSGFEGQGAFYFTMLPNGGGSDNTLSTSHNLFDGGVKLTADTTVGGGRFGFNTMDMQGYDLYTYCTNGQAQYEMYGQIKNAGNIRLKKGKALFERVAGFSPAVTTQCVVMADGTTIRMYDSLADNAMTTLGIRLEDDASARILATGGTVIYGRNVWKGDVHLDRGRKLTLVADREMTLDGAMDGLADLYKSGSYAAMITSNATHEFRSLTVEAGTLALGRNADETPYAVTNVWTVAGSAAGWNCARLDLGADLRTTSAEHKSSLEAIRVGYTGGSGNQYGIVSIGDGAVVSNEFIIGVGDNWRNAMGAVYMGDATVYWKAGAGNDGFIGSQRKGSGFFLQNGGTLTHTGYMNLGAYGRGVFVQRGGLHEILGGDPLKIARSDAQSYGLYHQSGGTFKGQNIWMCYDYRTNCVDVQAVVTTTGRGSRIEMNRTRLFVSYRNVEGVVNVNDGAVWCGQIYKDVAAKDVTWDMVKDACPNTKLYVNLNGGILTAKTADVLGADVSHAPDRVTVYEGGVTLDASDVDLVFCAPFEKPAGQGVASIALPANNVTNFNYYVGSPRVRIKSATGTGATAMADFNEKTRQVERIRVMSAGCDYVDATATIENNVLDEVPLGKVVLAELSTTGGVTKTGAKTATLTEANTYGGTTRLVGGTLAFTHEDGYPGGVLEISAAALMGASDAPPLLKAVRLAFNAGCGIRVTEAERLDKDMRRGLRDVIETTSPLTSLPPVTYVDSTGAEISPGGWTFLLDAGGRRVRFAYQRGTVLILR